MNCTLVVDSWIGIHEGCGITYTHEQAAERSA
jgi:hypothetical protein